MAFMSQDSGGNLAAAVKPAVRRAVIQVMTAVVGIEADNYLRGSHAYNPIAIEPGTSNTAFAVVVPDLPGCFSAGDTLDEAFAIAVEAAAASLDAAIDTGAAIPDPSVI